jgi:hypothetical protein
VKVGRLVVSDEAYSHPLGPDLITGSIAEKVGSYWVYIGQYFLRQQKMAIVLTPHGLRDVDWIDVMTDTVP